MPLTLEEFKRRWEATKRTERDAAHEHFLNICELLGVPSPAAADEPGEACVFEKHVSKTRGGKGFADVWKRGHFAWEYKLPGGDLRAAYIQLQDYLPDLENPPLLAVSDLRSIQVHTNYTNEKPRVFAFTARDLAVNLPTDTCSLPPLEVLRSLFGDFNALKRERTAERITADAAKVFLKLAQQLEIERPGRERSPDRPEVAHFLMRILFCLFADSIGLLPDRIFRDMIRADRTSPKAFTRKLSALFEAMSQPDSIFGAHDIKWFNGGLFEDGHVLQLDPGDMGILNELSRQDWSHVAPAIFGTLFERAFDKEKHALIGAHYTSPDDINLLIEPVLLKPLKERWEAVRAGLLQLDEARQTATGRERLRLQAEMEGKLSEWTTELAAVRVLDPACGSGNFLYLALRGMMDLWLKAQQFGVEHGLPPMNLAIVTPAQLYGIEQDYYSHELASIVVWIGYLQWRHEHALGDDVPPILKRLTNIEHADAILRTRDGTPYEPEWPPVDYIVGNPPFLGGKFLRRELGDKYVDDLFFVYAGRVPAEADLVTYWFEKARRMIELGRARRAGLLATQGIRGGASREVLKRILATGGIFFAQSDRPWLLDGAAVRVSMVGFDNGDDTGHELNGHQVSAIHANLSSGATDVTQAQRLAENANICFMGTTKVGPFELTPEDAQKMLSQPLNPNGRPNSDVVKLWVNATDITRRNRGMYIIDFGTDMAEKEAALYEWPFEYLKKHVKAKRLENKRSSYGEKWWIHGEARGDFRDAIAKLKRYIATPAVAKHRIFVWLNAAVLPDHATFLFARDDDYFFGILHSRFHELWARATGTQLREVESGFRYTPTSTFETFPFPWPPGKEPKRDGKVKAIAQAAAHLVELRDKWLNPRNVSAEDLQKLTLTNLYNKKPQWLLDAHSTLDAAVAAAYGWPEDIGDAEILERLLALNGERAG